MKTSLGLRTVQSLLHSDQECIAVSHSFNSKLHKVQNLLQDYFIKLRQTQNWERGKMGERQNELRGFRRKIMLKLTLLLFSESTEKGPSSEAKRSLLILLIELFVFLISWIIILKGKTESLVNYKSIFMETLSKLPVGSEFRLFTQNNHVT